MSDWPQMPLESLAAPEKSAISKPYGSSIRREDYTDRGIPVVRGVNLADGVFYDDGFVFISHQLADTMPGATLLPGDLVFTHRGTIGQVSMIPRSARYERYVASTSQVKARLDPSIASPEYYSYYFRSPQGQREILRYASTVGVPGIVQPVSSVKAFRVPHPPLSEQLAVARTLGALDDKIEVNEHIATTCARIIARSLRHSFEESGERFTEKPLSQTSDFINGRAFTKDSSGTGRMVIRIAEMNSGPGPSTVYNDLDVPERHLARPGDVLFAWSGSLTVMRWSRPEAIINQHIFKVVPRPGVPTWLAMQLILTKLDEFRSIAANKATTMGHIQRHHLDEPVLVPDSDLLRQLDTQLSPLWHRALLAEQESLVLAQLRDTLLPELMSGRLRVRDAEHIVEDAT